MEVSEIGRGQLKKMNFKLVNFKESWLILGLGRGRLYCDRRFAKSTHEWLPHLFSKPSAFPYMDSFTTVMSIVATFMLIRRK